MTHSPRRNAESCSPSCYSISGLSIHLKPLRVDIHTLFLHFLRSSFPRMRTLPDILQAGKEARDSSTTIDGLPGSVARMVVLRDWGKADRREDGQFCEAHLGRADPARSPQRIHDELTSGHRERLADWLAAFWTMQYCTSRSRTRRPDHSA